MADIRDPSPVNLWVFTDEHPDSINDGWLVVDPTTTTSWSRDLLGSFHNHANSLKFAEGHSELHKWREETTSARVTQVEHGGYAPEDARDYTVAACWEFSIPGRGMEVLNIGAVSMPAAVDIAIREELAADGSFEATLNGVAENLRVQVNRLVDSYRGLLLPPAPYYSVLMDGCLEQGRDLSRGLKYNNFGIHGACSANAADALAAVKKFVFEEEAVSAEQLLKALGTNFASDEPLRKLLRESAPKVGNNDESADAMLVKLFDFWPMLARRLRTMAAADASVPGADRRCIMSGWRQGMRG